METLSESTWDAVICGTGLQQSLLALALSRSDKKILHVDPNNYYGGPDAALSLHELEAWVSAHAEPLGNGCAPFGSARIENSSDKTKLSFSRAYSLALAPHVIHTRSEVLSKLVSSKAFRQLEFQAVGSFYIFKHPLGGAEKPALIRIPSNREDVFSATDIPARSKRQLMKFLKFALDYQDEAQLAVWKPHASDPFPEFLEPNFKLDADLRGLIMSLTLALDGSNISTEDGLGAIHRHITSMGMFGPGFAAVYPKWGGDGEIAQVACRALAVGGGVYVLGTGVRSWKPAAGGEEVDVELSEGTVIKTRFLFQDNDEKVAEGAKARCAIAVVSSALSHLFEASVEGAPLSSVVVATLPQGSISLPNGNSFNQPIFASIHSPETGECPSNQCLIYLKTLSALGAKEALDGAISSLLQAAAPRGAQPAECILTVHYEQVARHSSPVVGGNVFKFPFPTASIALDDTVIANVRQALELVLSSQGVTDHEDEFMDFADREPLGEDNDSGI